MPASLHYPNTVGCRKAGKNYKQMVRQISKKLIDIGLPDFIEY